MLVFVLLLLSIFQGFGPVVSNYLTGLNEELNELDYQLGHNEISKSDYENSKQRLTLLRKYVEKITSDTRLDMVPELQILASDKLAVLGGIETPKPELLMVGDVIDDRWKLIAIEGTKTKYLIFNKTQVLAKSRIQPNPQDVIETIVTRDKALMAVLPSNRNLTKSSSSRPRVVGRNSKIVEVDNSAQPPHIIYIDLPQYTEAASRRKLSGNLIISALLQKDRRVSQVQLERNIGYGLDDRALESVNNMVFMPAKLNGEKIDIHVNIVFTFDNGNVTYKILPLENN